MCAFRTPEGEILPIVFFAGESNLSYSKIVGFLKIIVYLNFILIHEVFNKI